MGTAPALVAVNKTVTVVFSASQELVVGLDDITSVSYTHLTLPTKRIV